MTSARRSLGGHRPRPRPALLVVTSRMRTPLRRLVVGGALSSIAVLGSSARLGAQDFAVPRAAYVVRLSAAAIHPESAPEVLRRTVSLRLERVTVAKALDELVARSGVSLTYSRAFIPADRIVSLDVEHVSVLQALGQLLGDSAVEVWVSSGGRIALVPADVPKPATPPEAVSTAEAFTAVITGRAVDSAGNRPLANVQVAVVGTQLGAMTNDAGRFTIVNVPAGTHTVRASLIGYAPQTRSVTVADGQSATVDFTMRRQAVELEQVVTVGYGTQSARNVTGSVANVDMSRIERQAVAGFDKALAGQVAGVQVLQSNGVPGGGPQIQVRGVGAIGAGSQPLYVIDGFPMPQNASETRNPLNQIAPGDIASIAVLKDASSAAIYGSRAANGVVVITTKSGANQAPTVRMDYAVGVQTVPKRYLPDVMNAQEFAQFMKELNEDAVRYSQKREPTLNDVPVEYRDPSQYAGKSTNWLDLITRNAPTHTLNASVSGGTQNISGYLSGGLLNEQGVIVATDYRRASMRANVNATPSPKLRVALNLAPTYELRNLPVTGGNGRNEFGSPGSASIMSPIAPAYNPDGTFNAQISSPGILSGPNPLMYLRQFTNKFQNLRALGSAVVEFRPIDGLLLKSQASGDYSEQQQTNFTPSTLGAFLAPPPRVPTGNYNESNTLNYLAEQSVTYDRSLGQHHAQLLGVYSVQAQRDLGGNFSGTQFPNDDIQTLNGANLITLAAANPFTSARWGLLSYAARLNYGFADGKYLASAAIRRDGSSRFAEANRWGVFSSASLGWRLSEESFFKRFAWLNDLKLRAAYGQTGNNDIGNYDYIGRINGGSANDYVLNNALATGRALGTLGNPNLGWEKTSEGNIGLDIALFNNRVSFSADAYNGITKDLLLNVEVPASSGFQTVTRNTGRVRNRGIEMQLHTVNMQRGSFQWTSDVNVSMNRNLVLALGANGAPIRSGASGEQTPTHITMIGQPVGMFYGFVFEGLYQSDAEAAATGYAGAIAGNVKMKDVNGDRLITPILDQEIIGNPYPDATFGINNQLELGRFDLSLIMTGQLGGERLTGFFEYLHNIDPAFNVTRDNINRWRSPSQPGDGKHPTTAGVARSRQLYRDVSSLWVQDATNLTIRNVTLRYRVPERFAFARVKDASIYLGIQNALTISSYPMNPEVTNYNRQTGALTPGYDAVAFPVARTFTVGTQFGF
jgi:TonB-dependent starch-binding outer membrane protein SusC